MEIVGIDRLAYELERLYTFVSSRHSGIGGHRRGAFVLWIAISVVFSALALWGAFHRCREQNVGPRRPSALRFAVGYSRRCGYFWGSLRFWPTASPRNSAKGKGAIVGEFVESEGW